MRVKLGGVMEFLLYLVLGGLRGAGRAVRGRRRVDHRAGAGVQLHLTGFDSEVLTHLAVGASLATIIFTSINSIREHHRKGAVRWPLVLWMTLGILIGAGIGALTAEADAAPICKKIIGVFAVVIAIQMALGLQPKASGTVPGKVGLTLAGTVIGWASAIFGIGGGSLTVPFLSWRSVPMQQAVATSSACGLPIALAGAASFMIIGWHNPTCPRIVSVLSTCPRCSGSP